MRIGIRLTGTESLGDPDFLDHVRDRTGATESLELGAHEPAGFLTLAEDALTRFRGYAAEVESRGEPPAVPYPEAMHYPTLAQIEASITDTQSFRHLIHVTGSAGVYVPLEFETPVVLRNLTLVGSTQQLKSELEGLIEILGLAELASALESELEEGGSAIEHLPEVRTALDEDPWAPEKAACLALNWAARHSLSRRLVVSFE